MRPPSLGRAPSETENDRLGAITGVEGINDADTLVGIVATPTDNVYEGFIATGKP